MANELRKCKIAKNEYETASFGEKSLCITATIRVY